MPNSTAPNGGRPSPYPRARDVSSPTVRLPHYHVPGQRAGVDPVAGPGGDGRVSAGPGGPPRPRISTGSDAVGALGWGLRRYWWLVLGSIVLFAVLGPLIAVLLAPTYDSTALVIAKQQGKSSALALPRYGATVFDQGQVTAAVSARFGDNGNPETVIPQRVSVVADQNSIVFSVIGHDPSPTTAADIANVAADTFVRELNAPGPGVGVFEVQSRATSPAAPTSPLASKTILVPVSVFAGLAMGLALLTALLAVRRPILEPGDAERVVRMPVLGTVTVPRRAHDGGCAADELTGLVQVCRRLLAMGPSSVVLVHAGNGEPARRRIALAMHSLCSRVGPVHLVTAHGPGADSNGRVSGQLTLVDGEQTLGVNESRDAVTLLVVPVGTSLRKLREAAAEHVAGVSRAGIVMVRVRRGRRAPQLPEPRAAVTAPVVTPEPARPSGSELAHR